MRAVTVAILLLVAAAKGALAGTQIEAEARGLGSDPPPTRQGLMSLEADRMRNLLLRADAVNAAREIVKQEVRSHANDPLKRGVWQFHWQLQKIYDRAGM